MERLGRTLAEITACLERQGVQELPVSVLFLAISYIREIVGLPESTLTKLVEKIRADYELADINAASLETANQAMESANRAMAELNAELDAALAHLRGK